MTLDPKVERIIEWRESFITLPDAHFFELVRMYLGEVKSPYNKQKLVEELGSFIRKEENKEALVKLLDASDIEICSAVKYLSMPTQEELASFFSGTFSFAELYEKVINLEERLILYRHEISSGVAILSINPLLEDTLDRLLSMSVLLPDTIVVERNESLPFTINPQFIASFISYTLSHSDMCKEDGAFKKRALTELKEIYGASNEDAAMTERLQLLVNAFRTMNILRDVENGVSVDFQRLNLFADLPPAVQYVYLSIAGSVHLRRSSLVSYAQLLLDTLASVPREGYSRSSLQRLAFIINEKDCAPNVADAAYLPIERFTAEEYSDFICKKKQLSVAAIMDSLIDACVSFGILYVAGKDESGDAVFAVSPLFTEESAPLPGNPKILSIDAAFSVTVMPGLSLSQLVPFAEFMDVVRYDTAAVFEINRHSTLRAFDIPLTPEQIFSLLEKYSLYEIPQNLRITIEEWYRSYTSVSLFKGYVLKVTSEDGTLPVEKNPNIAPYIKQVLAPGVYLLTVTSDEEVKLLIQKSGLDSIGTTKTAECEKDAVGLPVLHAQMEKNYFATVGEKKNSQQVADPLLSDETVKESYIADLKKELSNMTLSVEQKEGLEDRIERRIILNPVQLRATSVRLERLEAGGMDYNGKLHVIDSAMTGGCMIEIECEDTEVPLVGTPLLLTKKTDNAIVRVRLEPDHSERDISVGAALRVKKLRGSVVKH